MKLYRSEFEKITEGLSDALDFTRTIGVGSGGESMPFERGGGRGVLGEVDFYTRCVHGTALTRQSMLTSFRGQSRRSHA